MEWNSLTSQSHSSMTTVITKWKHRCRNGSVAIPMRTNAIKSIFLAITVVLVGCGRRSHPSDEQMIRNFQKIKPQMEELVQMIREDPITRISPDFSYPQYPAVAPVRLKKYRELLTDIKMPLGITKSPQG